MSETAKGPAWITAAILVGRLVFAVCGPGRVLARDRSFIR